MKIGIVRNDLASSGGAERYTLTLAAKLGGLGHEVHLFTAAAPEVLPSGSILHQMPAQQRRVFRLGPLKIKGRRPSRWTRHRQIEAWLGPEVEAAALDILLTNERLLPSDVFRAGGGVHRVWFEKCLADAPPRKRRSMSRNRMHRHLLEVEGQLFQTENTRHVICNSRMVAEEIQRHYAYPVERITVIHNGVDLERFRPGEPAERARLRAEKGIGEGEFVCFLAGSGFWRKGVDIAIDVVAELRRRGVPVHLFIAGKAEDKRFEAQAERSGAGPYIRFLGQKAPDAMLSWYQVADVFLFPTRYDPFSNACLEAAACGLPVVTSESNGFQEVVREGETGLILREGESVQDAANRIQEFLGHLPSPEKVRCGIEHLNFESHVQKLLNILQTLGPRGGPH